MREFDSHLPPMSYNKGDMFESGDDDDYGDSKRFEILDDCKILRLNDMTIVGILEGDGDWSLGDVQRGIIICDDNDLNQLEQV